MPATQQKFKSVYALIGEDSFLQIEQLNRIRAIMPDTATLLAELVGADLGRLDNELAKVALMCGDKKMIGPQDIAGCVAFQREQEMYDMTNELAMGRPGEAVRRWRQLLQLDSSAEF